MAQTQDHNLTIEIEEAVSKKTNKPYRALVIKLDDLQLDRVFIKDTEIPFFMEVAGNYRLELISK